MKLIHIVQKKEIKNEQLQKARNKCGNTIYHLYGLDVLSFLFLGPVNSTNYLVRVSENASLVGAGAFLLLIGGACASGIAISLYPVFKKFNRSPSSWSCWFQDFGGSVTFCFSVCPATIIS